ncbi:MAG: ABC transporter permease [Proteobacteria bacterium]|nr:ABC transporter permease [Pseudomonadota bacterium]
MNANRPPLGALVTLSWLVVFVAVPVALVLMLAFGETADRIPPIAPLLEHSHGHLVAHLTGNHLGEVLRDPLYQLAFANALRNAVETTVLCALIGFPIAYAIALAPERRRRVYLLLAILPFWTSFLMRTYAWIGLLRDSGPLNQLLLAMGIVDRPVHILYSPAAVLLVMVYSYLPFFILPMYAVLEKLPRDLLEAASDLGARPAYVFRTVTLPLSLPGLLAGSLLVFVPALGEYIIPDLVGNSDTIMLGGVLWTEFFENRDWPTAAALAAVASTLLIVPTLIVRQRMAQARAGVSA